MLNWALVRVVPDSPEGTNPVSDLDHAFFRLVLVGILPTICHSRLVSRPEKKKNSSDKRNQSKIFPKFKASLFIRV